MKGSTVGFGRNLVVHGDITNEGTITINPANAAGAGIAYIRIAENASISGDGELRLNANGAQLRIAEGKTLTVDADQQISGFGVINPASTLANSGSLVSNGSILADADGTLQINVSGSDTLTNNGTLRSTGAGGLSLQGTIVNNTAIEAHGSNVQLKAANVQGGTLRGTSDGAVDGTFELSNVTLDGVHLESGSFTGANGSTTRVVSSITNDGTVSVSNTGFVHPTTLRISDGVHLEGSGEIVLNNQHNSRVLTETDDSQFTIGSQQTLRGTGRLLNNSGGATNLGTIEADDVRVLRIDPGNSSQFVNQGTLRASGIGGIEYDGSHSVNEGRVEIASNSTLQSIGNYQQTAGRTDADGLLNTTAGADVQIRGGVLSGSGTVQTNSVNVESGARIAPGNSPGVLTIFGDVNHMAGAFFDYELFGSIPGIGHDLLQVGDGTVYDLGILNVLTDLSFANTWAVGDRFEVIRLLSGGVFSSGIGFDSITSNISGLVFSQLIDTNSMGTDSLYLTITDVNIGSGTVPAPGSLILILTGILIQGWRRRVFAPKTVV